MSFVEIAKQFALKPLPESEVEMTGDIPFEALAPYRAKALAHIAEHMELPGFRPGKVPQEVALPKEWKKLHETIALEPSMQATDEEVAKTLEDLRQSRNPDAKVGAPTEASGKSKPPELNDEFAKSIGAFENLEHLKTQIHKGIGKERAHKARDARRGKLIEALLEKTTLAVPRLFVESEQDKIMSQMREDVKRFGMELEEYFKKTNKTEEGVRQEFRDQALKRAKLQLVLNKIATEEKLDAEETAVATEMKHAFEHFPEANPELLKIHIETVLRNELALKLLEGELKIEAK